MGVGPYHCAAGWEAACAALQAAKSDVSRPVRDAAAGALPVLTALKEFLAAGAPPEQWPALSGALLAAERGGGPRRPVPAGSKLVAAAPAMTAADKPRVAYGQVAEEEATGSGQLIPAVHPQAMPGSAAAAAAAAAGSAAYHVPPGLAFPPSGPTAAAAAAAAASAQHMAAQLAALQEQQACMAAALTTFTATTLGTLHHLQQHLSAVAAGVAALAGGQQQAQLQQHLTSISAGMAALATGADGVAAQAQLHAQQQVQQPPVGSKNPKRLSSLTRSYQDLQQAATSSAAASRGAPPAPATTATTAAAESAPPAWEPAYAQLLAGLGADSLEAGQQAQLRLLRCMARSGPVWQQLSAPTQQRLLQAICGLLHGGTALKRLLPWLWPLADTAALGQLGYAAPAALRHQLLAALAAYPLPTEEQQQPQEGDAASSSAAQTLGDKRELLLSALRAVWI